VRTIDEGTKAGGGEREDAIHGRREEEDRTKGLKYRGKIYLSA